MTRTTAILNKICFISFCLFAFVLFSNSTQAQDINKKNQPVTRIAIALDQDNTNIWLSDFPAKTSVMLVDAENNLLGIISTNEYGAAYTSFHKPVVSAITAKTMNGEINVSNKAIIRTEPKNNNEMALNETRISEKV